MVFTEVERTYLMQQPLGRLATIGPTGAPQNHPVAYRVNESAATIDIGGPRLGESQKYRNIQADPRVALVVDDNAPQPVGPGGQRGRGIEIRGHVEILRVEPAADGRIQQRPAAYSSSSDRGVEPRWSWQQHSQRNALQRTRRCRGPGCGMSLTLRNIVFTAVAPGAGVCMSRGGSSPAAVYCRASGLARGVARHRGARWAFAFG
jgi:pyridoxamine 5'-phosphate oxidase family protein